MVVIVRITTQAFACYYERMSRSPNYAKILTLSQVYVTSLPIQAMIIITAVVKLLHNSKITLQP